MSSNGQEIAVDAAAGISIVSASYVWLESANQFASLGASAIAMLTGVAATAWYADRIIAAHRLRRERKARKLMRRRRRSDTPPDLEG